MKLFLLLTLSLALSVDRLSKMDYNEHQAYLAKDSGVPDSLAT
jgi:hypothetical protein